MKFPKASEEGKKQGRKLSRKFLQEVLSACYGKDNIPEIYDFELEALLLVVQKVMGRGKVKIHIGNPKSAFVLGGDRKYFPYGNKMLSAEIVKAWEDAKDMEPICKRCLKIMKTKKGVS